MAVMNDIPDDDPARSRRATYDRLSAHPDPVMREIAQQLRRGTRPFELLREPAYQRVLEQSIKELSRLDTRELAARLRSANIPARRDRQSDPSP